VHAREWRRALSCTPCAPALPACGAPHARFAALRAHCAVHEPKGAARAWTLYTAARSTRFECAAAWLQVFTLGGSWSGGVGGKVGEVFSGTAWRKLANVLPAPMETGDSRGEYRSDNHAWFFGWSNNEGARCAAPLPLLRCAMHVDDAGDGVPALRCDKRSGACAVLAARLLDCLYICTVDTKVKLLQGHAAPVQSSTRAHPRT
jgi:hypothetical protein